MSDEEYVQCIRDIFKSLSLTNRATISKRKCTDLITGDAMWLVKNVGIFCGQMYVKFRQSGLQ